jgi:hypothetical protein
MLIDTKYIDQIRKGDHPQFVYDFENEKVMCRCGHAAVFHRTSYICGTITAYPCKYNSIKKRREDVIRELNGQIIKASYPKEPMGGQHCGIISRGIHLYLEELDIDIKINMYRSQHRNLEIANALMQLAIEEYVK